MKACWKCNDVKVLSGESRPDVLLAVYFIGRLVMNLGSLQWYCHSVVEPSVCMRDFISQTFVSLYSRQWGLCLSSSMVKIANRCVFSLQPPLHNSLLLDLHSLWCFIYSKMQCFTVITKTFGPLLLLQSHLWWRNKENKMCSYGLCSTRLLYVLSVISSYGITVLMSNRTWVNIIANMNFYLHEELYDCLWVFQNPGDKIIIFTTMQHAQFLAMWMGNFCFIFSAH